MARLACAEASLRLRGTSWRPHVTASWQLSKWSSVVHVLPANVLHRAFGARGSAVPVLGAATAAARAAHARRHGRSNPVKKEPLRPRGITRQCSETKDSGATFEDDLSKKLRNAFQGFEAEVSQGDSQVDLLRAAALLSLHADPSLDLETQVFQPLAQLGRAFDAHVASVELVQKDMVPEAMRLHTLAACLCSFMRSQGFKGCGRSAEAYYDAENSLMNKVLERRVGIPISLSLVYIVVGQAVGLELRGVNFPGHFLLAFGEGSNTGLVDAFTNAVIPIDQAEQIIHAVGGELPRIPNRILLLRMLRNLQGVYERDGNFSQAARATQYAQMLEDLVRGPGAPR